MLKYTFLVHSTEFGTVERVILTPFIEGHLYRTAIVLQSEYSMYPNALYDTLCKNNLHTVATFIHFQKLCNTVKPVFKTTWEIGTTWELRTATSVPMPIQYREIDLRNKTTSEFRTVFHSPLGVPNSQVSL